VTALNLDPPSAVAAGKCLMSRIWKPGMAGGNPDAYHPRPCAWEDFTRQELAHMLDDFNAIIAAVAAEVFCGCGQRWTSAVHDPLFDPEVVGFHAPYRAADAEVARLFSKVDNDPDEWHHIGSCPYCTGDHDAAEARSMNGNKVLRLLALAAQTAAPETVCGCGVLWNAAVHAEQYDPEVVGFHAPYRAADAEVAGLRAALTFLSTYEKRVPEVMYDEWAYNRLLAFIHDTARAALAAQPAAPEAEPECVVCGDTEDNALHRSQTHPSAHPFTKAPRTPEAEPERCTGCGATEERFHDSNIKYHGSAWHPFTPAPR
jgi:hypothetical protein